MSTVFLCIYVMFMEFVPEDYRNWLCNLKQNLERVQLATRTDHTSVTTFLNITSSTDELVRWSFWRSLLTFNGIYSPCENIDPRSENFPFTFSTIYIGRTSLNNNHPYQTDDALEYKCCHIFFPDTKIKDKCSIDDHPNYIESLLRSWGTVPRQAQSYYIANIHRISFVKKKNFVASHLS